MCKRTAIKAALCIIVAIASTPVLADQLWSNGTDRPTGDVWLSRGETPYPPLHATAPTSADDLDSPRGDGLLPSERFDRDGTTSPSQITLDIVLTMRRPHKAGRRHRAVRSCR